MAVIDPIGPYSRPHSLAKVDGRTRLAKLMRKTRAALTAHVGGDPSTTQRALIERVVWLTVKCCQNEAKILAGKDTEYDGKSYLAWSNALRRAVAGPWDAAEHTTVSNPCRRVENGTGCMIDAPSPLAFFDKLRWLDHRPLLDTIEPYRRNIFEGVLYTFDGVRPRYNLAVCGRAKKNWKTSDLILAALYRLLVWPSPQGNDCFILANDEGQAADDLDLAKKLVTANPIIAREVDQRAKEIIRKDGQGRMQILPARDIAGAHGKTYSFVGFDEIHAYRSHDLFEALAPDPTPGPPILRGRR